MAWTAWTVYSSKPKRLKERECCYIFNAWCKQASSALNMPFKGSEKSCVKSDRAKIRSICLRGDDSYQLWHSVVTVKQLGSVSQRSVVGWWTQVHAFKPWSMKSVCMCEGGFEWVSLWMDIFVIVLVCCVCVHAWYIVLGLKLIQRVSQCRMIDHLLCVAESCWTAVSYVNGPFVQRSNKKQHIHEMQKCKFSSERQYTRGYFTCVRSRGTEIYPFLFLPHYRLMPASKESCN